MRRIGLAACLLAAACDGAANPVAPPAPRVPLLVPDGFSAHLYASGLELPTSIAFPPDGSNRLFVNELQSGRVRILENGALRPEPFASVPTNAVGGFPVSGENGLLGIAFDPQYASNGHVYITYATRTGAGTFGTVARLTDVDNRGVDHTVLLDGIPAAPGHQVQSLAFGPDGKLYVSVGDAFTPDEAQKIDVLPGKVLRMNPDGSIPMDNPFPGSYTWALGLRNSFDLAFDGTGALYAADNGPGSRDELNRIVAGGNYAWPLALGATFAPEFVSPLVVWPEIVSPNGMAFYGGAQFPAAYRGKLFLVLFGDTFSRGPSPRAKRIQIVDLSSTPPALEDFAVYDFTGIGNPLDLAVGPDGSLFLSDIFQGHIFRIRYTG